MEFPKTNNKTVCIVATGYAWEQCVFGTPEYDYWTLNNMYEAGVKSPDMFDEWFQIHRPGSGEGHVDDKPMRNFLQEFSKPIWTQKDWGKEMPVKNQWTYPIDEIMLTFCPRDVYGVPYPYFTNSVDYMLCLAGFRGYEEIRLYGVEFISEVDDEYYSMRQSVNFYIGRLLERGINIVVQPHSSLLKCPYWYGYKSPRKDPLEKIMKENLGKINNELQKHVEQKAKVDETIKMLEGGIQTLQQLLKIAKLRDKGAQI
jgi:hypothetical protein